MRSFMKYCILFILLSTLFPSCVKYVDLEHLRPESKLVLNSVVQTGYPLTATVTRTWFYTDNNPNVTIKDAKVSLYVNGQYLEDMLWYGGISEYNSIGYYFSDYVPSEGDKVRLEVRKEGFKEVSAECELPVKPELLKVEIVSERSNDDLYGSSYNYRTICKTTFKDDPKEGDCYLVRVARGSPEREYGFEKEEWGYPGTYRWREISVDYVYEPVFKDKITILDELFGNADWLSGYNGRPFSDELINGMEYSLKLGIGHSDYPSSQSPDKDSDNTPPSYMKVYLYTLSKPYYQYLMALAELDDHSVNNDLMDAGLAEPVRVTSNIIGGSGILGAASVDTVTVEIPYGL